MKFIMYFLPILLILSGCAQPPEQIATAIVDDIAPNTITKVDTNMLSFSQELYNFTFEGYAIGKSHTGTFTDMQIDYTLVNNTLTAHVLINASSVSTGINGLDTHLKDPDFFDVDLYPTIQFSTNVTLDTLPENIQGLLTFRNISKMISFPIINEEDTIYADFLLNTDPFQMQYLGVDSNVRIAFSLVLPQENQ